MNPDSHIIQIVGGTSSTHATRAAVTLEEAISGMLRSGMTPDAIREFLLNDLREGGNIFGSLVNEYRKMARQNIEQVANQAAIETFKEKTKDDDLWIWELDPRIENHCDDCIERSEREPMQFEAWELIGLPQSGVTQCVLNCGCKLIPVKSN